LTWGFSDVTGPKMWREAVAIRAEDEVGSVDDDEASAEPDGVADGEKSTRLTLTVRDSRTRWDSVEPVEDTF
jgi:hypothetical protein